MKKHLYIFSIFAMSIFLFSCSKKNVLTGEADGYGGKVIAKITVDANNKITDLKLTGDNETANIGGTALKSLQDAIIKAGTIEGIDVVSGATWTSKAVFEAINAAMNGGNATQANSAQQKEVTATGLSHGLGIASSGRIGPGKDDKGVGVYSINEVIAYVLFDDAGKILDLEVDQLEVATPNYDGEYMPKLTGLPGQEYNADENHDEKVDTVLTQTSDTYLAQIDTWKTKRERGETYKLNTASWQTEMDEFEEMFRGMTVEEVKAWYAKCCSDVNGRPLKSTSTNEKDVAKYAALSDTEKASLDALSSATMSLNDAHGNIIAAIEKAYNNRKAVKAANVAKIGLGVRSAGRSVYWKDSEGKELYYFNVEFAGAMFGQDGKIVGVYTDCMEVASPNASGGKLPKFTGFPGQSYRADTTGDGKVDATSTQTDDSFLSQVGSWITKRERGDAYKMDSGNWAQEMDIYENFFVGKTTQEVQDWYAKFCSDETGRPLNEKVTNGQDIAKYSALTDADKQSMDALTGATMSLKSSDGDIVGVIAKSYSCAKDTKISFN